MDAYESLSQQYSLGVTSMRRELEALSRKDLQALAKQEGVKANGRNCDIVDALLRLPWEEDEDVQPKAAVQPGSKAVRINNGHVELSSADVGRLSLRDQESSSNAAGNSSNSQQPIYEDVFATCSNAVQQSRIGQLGSKGSSSSSRAGAGASAVLQTPGSVVAASTMYEGPLQQQLQALQQQQQQQQQGPAQSSQAARIAAARLLAAKPASANANHAEVIQQSQPLLQQQQTLLHDNQQHGQQQQHQLSNPSVQPKQPRKQWQRRLPQHSSMVGSWAHPDTVQAGVLPVSRQQKHPQVAALQPSSAAAPAHQNKQMLNPQEWQQQSLHTATVAASTPHKHNLHTPLRVRAKDSCASTTAALHAAAAAVASGATGRQPLLLGAQMAPPATPLQQQVRAISGMQQSALPGPSVTHGIPVLGPLVTPDRPRHGQAVTPDRTTQQSADSPHSLGVAANAAAAAAQCGAPPTTPAGRQQKQETNGLASPHMGSVMGSARRIMSRTKGLEHASTSTAGATTLTAAAAVAAARIAVLNGAVGQATAAAMQPAVAPVTPLHKGARRTVPPKSSTVTAASAMVPATPTAAAAIQPVPVTPLGKPARRNVPPESEQCVGETDKQLEELVERCLRNSKPGALHSAHHGSEPAKRWLQQHIIAPIEKAQSLQPFNNATSSSSNTAAPQQRQQQFKQLSASRHRSSSSSSSSSLCLAAGFCHIALLLYGPAGSGKTELVHALAGAVGAELLYVPAGDLLKSYQEHGQRLLRALFKVARRVSPTVVCFDDAHLSFPADARLSQPSHDCHKMLVELVVQLQQFADMQSQLQGKLAENRSSSKSSSSHKAVSDNCSNGSVKPNPLKSKRPPWGGVLPGKQQQGQQQDKAAAQHSKDKAAINLPNGPVVVVFATRHPEALEPRLLALLPIRLLLDLPERDRREELLMGWLLQQEAALGVQDVEQLVRATEDFSCSDLLHLCHEAALKPVQERSRRAVCMKDFEAALRKVTPIVPQQRRAQLRTWT